ncbi:MAG: pyridoxamine 5'-phosphate oxidase family protein [Actinomycetota bacterium]
MGRPEPELPAMSSYGVGDGEWSPLPWGWAAQRLATTRNFWLATASSAARPHALPVWGVWDDEALRFGFSCARGARKARNLQENASCAFAIDDTVECVSVEGRAAELEAGADLEAWIERYLAKYAPIEPSLNGEFLRANLFVEVIPERAFGVIERPAEFAARATRWSF